MFGFVYYYFSFIYKCNKAVTVIVFFNGIRTNEHGLIQRTFEC